MEAADTLYGVTMQEHGVSKVVSLRLDESLEKNADDPARKHLMPYNNRRKTMGVFDKLKNGLKRQGNPLQIELTRCWCPSERWMRSF